MKKYDAWEILEGLEITNPSKGSYFGPSDHLPHEQLINFNSYHDRGSVSVQLDVCTFNVLNPHAMKYINGRDFTPEGVEIPTSIDLANQQGLEDCWFANPLNRERREASIERKILKFFRHRHSDKQTPQIMVIQECWKELQERLVPKLVEFGISSYVGQEPLKSKSFCWTIFTQDLNPVIHAKTDRRESYTCSLVKSGMTVRFALSNVHMPFKTVDILNTMESISKIPQDIHIIAGDFNVQFRQLSDSAISEGSTITFPRLVEELQEYWPRWEVKLGQHCELYTNWNARMNCKDRLVSSDHFDNILFMYPTLDLAQELKFPYAAFVSMEPQPV